MRQLAITAQRHREQDELRSQAQLTNTGPSQTGIRDSESISSRSDIRLSIPEADTRIGHPNRSQIPEHEGMQFEPELGNSDDEDDDDELLDNESDFDAEPRVDDRRPCTPNDPSSGEEDFGEGSSMDGGDDLIDEQLFIPRSALFNPYQLGDIDKEDDETVDSLAEIHPAIINTYIRAFVSATFKGATHDAVSILLDGARLQLHGAIRDAPNLHYPGLSDFARTLPTVERRLGLSTEQFITYYFLCDECWEPHHPKELSTSLPVCEEHECSGTLYTTKRLTDGSIKRTPTKILSYVNPQKAIQKLLLRPGKYEQLQAWRGPGDEPRRVAPTTTTGRDAFPDPSQPMHDIKDGYGWRMIQAGLSRQQGGRWGMEDVDVKKKMQRFVSLRCGLVWQINFDW